MIPRFQGFECGRLISAGHGRHVNRTINTWELLLVISGKLGMFCGSKSFKLNTGDWLLLPPGIPHGGTMKYPHDLSFYWIHFLPRDREATSMLKNFLGIVHLVEFKRLSDYFLLYQSLQRESPMDTDAIDSVAGLIVHEALMARLKSELYSRSADAPILLRNLEKKLMLRYREPLSISSLASELRVSADYLGRMFRKYRGHGIVEELHNQRMLHARVLLQQSPLTVSQILYEVGYNDPVHFRRQFFHRYGMTPGEFRSLKNCENVNTE